MARRSDDDDAPWLAEALPARGGTEVSRRSFVWTLLIVLALGTIAVVGAILLMAKKDGGSTQGYMNAEQAPVITAEPGPYKIRPADPAGMKIEGIDGTMYDAGEGIDASSAIDPSLAPEMPLPRPGTTPGTPEDLLPQGVDEAAAPPPIIAAPAAKTPAKPMAVAPAAPPPAAKPAARPLVVLPPPPDPAPAKTGSVSAGAPVRTGSVPAPAPAKSGSVQLGAFSSAEKAEAAWGTLAGKYGLSGKRVTAVESSGKTLYRLRAASADPAATCTRMKAAGDACAAVE